MTEDRTPFGFQVLSAFFRLLQGCSHGLVRLRSARFVRFCSDLFEFVRIRFISLAPVLAVLPTVAGNTGDWKVSRTIGSELRQPCTAVCMDDLSRSCVLWLEQTAAPDTVTDMDARPAAVQRTLLRSRRHRDSAESRRARRPRRRLTVSGAQRFPQERLAGASPYHSAFQSWGVFTLALFHVACACLPRT